MSYIDWNLIQQCTDEERQKATTFIKTLMTLKHHIEENGVKALDDYIQNNANQLQQKCAQYIIEGYMPELCKKLMYNILNSKERKPLEYLQSVIFIEFLLIIQKNGLGDTETRLFLLSFLGEENL